MIDILLSTFQSETYLEEQINSLLNQTYKDWNLIIRDDGSEDNTVDILKNYQIKYPDKIKIDSSIVENIGIMKSFEFLLSLSKAEYIMFCDHDDVWMPDKIDKTLKKMIETENQHPQLPVLIHTDLKIVDSNKKVINKSFWKFSGINAELLKSFNYLGVCNGITACTVMFNKKTKEVSLPFSEHARMHDLWIGLCVSKNGYIEYLNEATILYRQHTNNTIGISRIKSNYFKNKFLNIKYVFTENMLQLKMLNDLNYGSFFKYLIYKSLYIIKNRI